MIPLINVRSKVNSGHIAVDSTNNTLIIWGKENEYYTGDVFNIEYNKLLLKFWDESVHSNCNCIPYFMSEDELIVLNSENGSFGLYDLISGKRVENINLPGIM